MCDVVGASAWLVVVGDMPFQASRDVEGGLRIVVVLHRVVTIRGSHLAQIYLFAGLAHSAQLNRRVVLWLGGVALVGYRPRRNFQNCSLEFRLDSMGSGQDSAPTLWLLITLQPHANASTAIRPKA